ncbi:MAG: hypothetical protein IGR93_22415 [Hydrococcus sp. C42_A2020_068]|nr:hypothetical protein [Hydrococcus sp. C42_A2020_068]
MQKLFNFCVCLSAAISLPTILLTLSIPIRPAAAANEFSVCVNELIDRGVPAQQAGVACSDALIPKELSECVSKIREGTPIKPEEALTACYRVRRPVDLANCVVDIHAEVLSASTPQANKSETSAKTNKNETSQVTTPEPPPETEEPGSIEPTESPTKTDTEESPSLVALDSCRRSLLPGRHSECVIALAKNVPNTSPVTAMATCLSAEDFPRELFPAFTNN